MLKRLISLSTVGLEKEDVLTRYQMYQRLKSILAPLSFERTLNVSKSDYLCSLIGSTGEILTADYDDGISILDLPFPDQSFDAIVSDQVLEHVNGSPFAVIDESLRVLKPGGYMIHTTCLLNPIHGYPSDYWRFTPNGLELLVEGRAELVEAAGWGNWLAVLMVHVGLRSLLIPESTWHPLHRIATRNSDRRLISVWLVARRAPYS